MWLKHRTCGIDNCTFTGHEKDVEKHIEMQHITGLYDKIKNVVTPEDIAKWIADRKKKYPTKQNVEKRYREQEEMLKRGERIKKNRSRFDHKNKTRITFSKKPKIRKITKKPTVATVSTSLIQEKSDWNGNVGPFRGTSQLYQENTVEEVEEYDDGEWIENAEIQDAPITLNNALGSLMNAYNSESDQDAEPPVEEKITVCRENVVHLPPALSTQKVDGKHKRKRKRGIHKKNTNIDANNESLTKSDCKIKPIYKKRKVTLLERLLANEIVNERNLILQCVRYVVSNNFFDKKTEVTNNMNES